MTTSINRLKQEHRVLAAAGEDLLETLTEIVSGVLLPRAIVEAAAATYLVYFRHHLAYEEREILPVAAKLLTPEDWRAVSAAVPGAPDPLFGEDSDSGYRDLRRQIAEES